MNEDRTQKRRNDILNAAFEVFAENGFHATKISDIAEKLQMGHGTFYRYFKNKLEIFSAVIDKVFVDVIGVIADEPATLADDLEAFRAQARRIGEKLFRVFCKDKRLAKIFFYEVTGVHQDINDKFEQLFDWADRYSEQFFVNGIDKGFFKKSIDPHLVAHAVNSIIFTSARDIVLSDEPESIMQRWLDTIILMMLDGVAKH